MTVTWTPQLQVRYRKTMIVSLAVASTVLAFMFVAYVLTSASPSPEPLEPPQVALIQILYGAAFLIGLGVILGRRTFFRESRLGRIVENGGLEQLVNEFFVKTIVLVALSEAVGTIGLVLSVLTKSMEPMWRLGVVSILLLFYNLPRRSAWEQTVESFSRFVSEEPPRMG